MSGYDGVPKWLLPIFPFSGRYSIYHLARRFCDRIGSLRGWNAVADFEIGLYEALTDMGQLRG